MARMLLYLHTTRPHIIKIFYFSENVLDRTTGFTPAQIPAALCEELTHLEENIQKRSDARQ